MPSTLPTNDDTNNQQGPNYLRKAMLKILAVPSFAKAFQEMYLKLTNHVSAEKLHAAWTLENAGGESAQSLAQWSELDWLKEFAERTIERLEYTLATRSSVGNTWNASDAPCVGQVKFVSVQKCVKGQQPIFAGWKVLERGEGRLGFAKIFGKFLPFHVDTDGRAYIAINGTVYEVKEYYLVYHRDNLAAFFHPHENMETALTCPFTNIPVKVGRCFIDAEVANQFGRETKPGENVVVTKSKKQAIIVNDESDYISFYKI